MTSSNRFFLVVVVTIIAVHFVLHEATFERAAVRKGKVLFPPGLGLRAIFLLGVPLELFGAYELAQQAGSPADWFLPTILLFLAFGTVYFDPGTISVDDRGIYQNKFFGLYTKRIPWSAVQSAVVSKPLKTISVFGPESLSVVHTQFHVDPLRFQSEIAKHVRVITQ